MNCAGHLRPIIRWCFSALSWGAFLVLWNGVSAAEQALVLTPIGRSPATAGRAPFVVGPPAGSAVAFRAVVGHDWLPGLAPLFVVDKDGRHELRRLPGKGQENFSEPLFFALPPEDEPEAARLAGRWEAAATRSDGSKVRVALELAIAGERVAGRFDQNTDYRFANVTAGSIRTNRLELEVTYINDVHRLILDAHADRWSGRWRRADDTEGGELELWRRLGAATLPAGLELVALHECRREGEEGRLYLLTDEPVPAGWERLPRPLCRVWRAVKSSKNPPLPR